jgi:hypothetical protein
VPDPVVFKENRCVDAGDDPVFISTATAPEFDVATIPVPVIVRPVNVD